MVYSGLCVSYLPHSGRLRETNRMYAFQEHHIAAFILSSIFRRASHLSHEVSSVATKITIQSKCTIPEGSMFTLPHRVKGASEFPPLQSTSWAYIRAAFNTGQATAEAAVGYTILRRAYGANAHDLLTKSPAHYSSSSSLAFKTAPR